MKSNERATNPNRTHEGGMAAPKQSAEVELERAVLNCLLFERTFYESGDDIAGRIAELVPKVAPERVAALAVKARQEYGLRHVSLWIARHLAKCAKGKIVGDTIDAVIRRADEPAEFLSLYWKSGRQPLSKQVKRGLAMALARFNEFQLAKYDQDGAVKLRDALFLSHAKPKDGVRGYTRKARKDGASEPEGSALFGRIVRRELATPDTWEVALSGGADKKATWERLLGEDNLGALALIRNLRNMEEVGVDRALVIAAMGRAKTWGILPFQFVAAWREAPAFARAIEEMMLRALAEAPKLSGLTVMIVDRSGSMQDKLSAKGTLTRMDAAGALAVYLSEVAADLRVFSYATDFREVAGMRGLALAGAVGPAAGGTMTAAAITQAQRLCHAAERVIVITDEQAHDRIAAPWGLHNYLVNIAPYKPALDTSGGWVRINGWSDRMVEWIRAVECDGGAR